MKFITLTVLFLFFIKCNRDEIQNAQKKRCASVAFILYERENNESSQNNLKLLLLYCSQVKEDKPHPLAQIFNFIPGN